MIMIPITTMTVKIMIIRIKMTMIIIKIIITVYSSRDCHNFHPFDFQTDQLNESQVFTRTGYSSGTGY